MKRGRKPLPKTSKIIRGTFRKYRDGKPVFTPPPVAVPKPPAGMNRWARAQWKKLAGELAEQGLLTSLDLVALQLCAEAYGTYVEAREAIYRPRDPETGKHIRRTLAQYLEGRNSQTAPELTAMRAAERAFRMYLSEFGLSPSARQRLAPPKTGDAGQDPMEKLLNEV